jgi:hypothetical protein
MITMSVVLRFPPSSAGVTGVSKSSVIISSYAPGCQAVRSIQTWEASNPDSIRKSDKIIETIKRAIDGLKNYQRY